MKQGLTRPRNRNRYLPFMRKPDHKQERKRFEMTWCMQGRLLNKTMNWKDERHNQSGDQIMG